LTAKTVAFLGCLLDHDLIAVKKTRLVK